MECRINAEDPFRNFLPSTGRLVRYLPPPVTMEAAQPVPEGGGVRVDTGVYEGGEIPMYYDSMIAKLVVHGFDREDAIRRMREALNGFVIRGVSSNIPFQAALLAHPKFVAGDFNTGFIAEHYGKGFRAQDVPHDDPDFLVALAAAAYRRYRERAARITGQLPGYEMKIGEEFVAIVRGEAGMHARRQVQFLLSAKKRKRRAARGTKTETVFSLPPSSRPMKVTYWKERRNHHVSVTRQKPRGVLRIVASPTIVGRGQLLTYDGDRRLFQGSILRRVVRFLLSNRPTSKQQAVSCVLPLFGLPVPSRGHPRKCRTIDWREIIGETV